MWRTVARGTMAGIGAAGGLCLYALGQLWDQGVLPERVLLALTVFGAVFFAGCLAMTGPLRPGRAALGAVLIAGVVAALALLTALRFDRVYDLSNVPWHFLAGLILAVLAQPFWIAGSRRGWGHYPTLFTESWSVVVRVGAALVFTALVWGVVFLSDALLRLVGVEVIGRLIELDAVPYLLSGAVLGLALSVMTELSDVVSPDLLLRLLRLLVPVLLPVVSVFLVALALRGFDRLFGSFSVAGTLIAVAVAAILLVSAAVDSEDAEGVVTPPMVAATQALAALVVLPAALGAWALVLRVGEAGWTPARIAGLAAAAVAVGYGLAYLWALAGGQRWRARVRAGNRTMAVAILALSALWLSPLLNAEAIAARDLVARVEDGRTPLDRLDLYALQDWGRPGVRGMARLQTIAEAPGQEALATALADHAAGGRGMADPEAGRTALAALLPVSPRAATAVRDRVLAALEPWEVEDWRTACAARLPDGRPGCVLVVADFWPDVAGDEVVALFRMPHGGLRSEALTETADGSGWQRRSTLDATGAVTLADAGATLAALQDGDPVLVPVPQFQLQVGGGALVILP